MKKFLSILMTLCFVLMPTGLFAGKTKCYSYDYWLCSYVGRYGNQPVLVTTEVFYSNGKCSEEKVEIFEKKIKKELSKSFKSDFAPICRDFRTFKDAKKFLKKSIERAQNYNYHIVHIKMTEVRK